MSLENSSVVEIPYNNHFMLKIAVDISGKLWFNASDVANILRYTDIDKAIDEYVEGDDKKDRMKTNEAIRDSQTTSEVYINNCGVCSLIISSKSPQKTSFKQWFHSYLLNLVGNHKIKKLNHQLALAANQTQLKEKCLQDLQLKLRQAEQNEYQLRSEAKKNQEYMRKALEFNQATKQVEELEYIYVATNDINQKKNHFKVGGTSSYDLLKGRLSNYNCGRTNDEKFYFVFVRKTASFRAIEIVLQRLLPGFKENKDKEMYVIHFEWLEKCLNIIMDSTAEFTSFVNENREKIYDDTIKKLPATLKAISLDAIENNFQGGGYQTVGEASKQTIVPALDQKIIDAMKVAIQSFNPTNNMFYRQEFEQHLQAKYPDISLNRKKKNVWFHTKRIGSQINPYWTFRYRK